ncbi:MAG: MGMT family protein [Thermoplasmatales archaeon]|nr:MAG: MGMT family protein [Thermoplasmatales archaeon]
MATKKSWLEKLADNKDLPKVVRIKPNQEKRWGKGTIVIPAPKEVDQIMKKVPKSKLITINQIREKVAKKHKATIGCPITCGIFARIAAGAAEEERAEGKKDITPYWRTLKSGGVINEKYPGYIDNIKALLESEGHHVVKKGKKYVVEDYESSLASI